MIRTDRVLVVGALDNGKGATGSFLKVGGVSVGYAYLVYSPRGLCPTQCSAHFQSLILVEDEETDSNQRDE
jgi:hypothetical protein